MMKQTFVMLGVAAVLAGCGATGPKNTGTGVMATTPAPAAQPMKRSKAECMFPDLPSEEAPLWVCDLPVEGVAVSAVGAYEKTAAGVGFQKDQALADGRVKLAQQVRVRVSNMIKQYAETTGAGSTETVDKVNSSVSKLITAETLTGSRAYRSTSSSNSTMYVLVGLDPSATQQAAERALKTSMKNDGALWQQFKSQKAQEELAAEIAKGAAGN